MKKLIIYDNEGYILNTHYNGYPLPREPIGVPFIWVDIPEGKRIKTTEGIGVDVSVTPHEVILEDMPPTEIEILKQEDLDNKEAIADLYMMMLGGM